MDDDNNQNLYMVVGIDKSKRHQNYAWVSFANLAGSNFIKHWMDLSKNEKIKYGTVGVFDETGNLFFCTQEYFDLKQRYSVGQVMLVEQGTFLHRPRYRYHVGLANGDFDTSVVDSPEQLATVGNRLLLFYDKYKMNLTTTENCWNLLNHYNVGKYDLHPSYRGFMANKYWNNAHGQEYKNCDNKLVQPVVISKHIDGNSFWGFFPQVETKNRWRDIHIVVEGVYRPLPRPSDIVLLEQTEEKDTFILADNLTMSAQLRDMQNKFELPQHQAEMTEYYQKCYGERE